MQPAGPGSATSDIFVRFRIPRFGDQGPEQFYLYPKDLLEPWIEFHSPKLRRGCIPGSHDRADRRGCSTWKCSRASRDASWDGNWPRARRNLTACLPAARILCHFAESAAGQSLRGGVGRPPGARWRLAGRTEDLPEVERLALRKQNTCSSNNTVPPEYAFHILSPCGRFPKPTRRSATRF